MTTSFSNASFKGTHIGGPGGYFGSTTGPTGVTPRTLGDRVGDTVNVKDFGAAGDGSTNDSAAIQAAVDWASTANRGTIYFPPGKYVINSAITFNYNGPISIIFSGEGSLSELNGNFNDFILKRDLSPSDAPSSGVRGVEKLRIVNGHATGGAIMMGSSVNGFVRDCDVSAHYGIIMSDSDSGASQSVIVENCTLRVDSGGFSGSIGVSTTANAVISNCDITGIETGIACSRVSGVVIQACRFEVNGTGITCGDITGARALPGAAILGGTFESNSTAIDAAALSKFIIAGLTIQGFNGAAPGGLNPQYGIRLRNQSQYGVIQGITVSGNFDVACISIEDTTVRGGLVFEACSAVNATGGGAVAWAMPSKAHTAEFINCDALPTFTFANLPSGGDLREGDKYYITDANTATLGNNVTAGGAPNTHGYVVWNGSNWTLMSK